MKNDDKKTGLNIKDTKQMVKKILFVKIYFLLIKINRIIGLNKFVNNQHEVHFERYKSLRQREVLEDLFKKKSLIK